jgi:RNA polymerase sigma-70 factor (ECF subfamily)
MSESAIETLLERFRSGDESAAEQLYRDYEPFLRGAVRRRLPSRMRGRFDSTDIVQSAWASLIDGFREARWRFPDAANFRAFLTRVTLCRLYDRARQAGTQTNREVAIQELEGNIPGMDPRPSEYAQAETVWQLLLAECPLEHRPVLRLRRLGFTCEEIGERIGLHPGSVRRILRLLARRMAFNSPDNETTTSDAN